MATIKKDKRIKDYDTRSYSEMVISLSLRKQGCKSTGYVIYTFYYTQKVSRYFLYGLLRHDVRDSILTYLSELLE